MNENHLRDRDFKVAYSEIHEQKPLSFAEWIRQHIQLIPFRKILAIAAGYVIPDFLEDNANGYRQQNICKRTEFSFSKLFFGFHSGFPQLLLLKIPPKAFLVEPWLRTIFVPENFCWRWRSSGWQQIDSRIIGFTFISNSFHHDYFYRGRLVYPYTWKWHAIQIRRIVVVGSRHQWG